MKEKISTIQICSIAYFILLSNNLGIITYNLLQYTRQDSLISLIIGFILGFIPLLIYIKIMNYRPDLTFFQKIETILPKKIANIINLIISGTILYIISVFFYNMTDFISSQYLSRTPSMIISIVFIPPIIYLLTKGLTVIGRTTFVLLIISLTLLTLTILGLFSQIELQNILPILENGIKGPFKHALVYICYNIVPLILITSIPLNNITDKEKFNKRIIITYIFASMVMFTVFFLILTILGVNIATLYQFPEYDLLKKISLVGFIQRTESTVSLRWIFYILIIVVMGIYYVTEYIKHTFKIKNQQTNKIIISAITILIIISANFLFKNSVVANIFIDNKLSIIIGITLFILPLLLSLKLKRTK